LLKGTTFDDSIKVAARLAESYADCLDLPGGISGYLKKEGFFPTLLKLLNRLIESLKGVEL
jgi:hypothetical protein